MVGKILPLTLAVFLGCSDSTDLSDPTSAADHDGPTEVEMVAAMEAHYTSTILAHDALIQGDLVAFREQLAMTATHALPASAPEAWKPYADRLRGAAESAAQAQDLESAAATMGAVALACGTCHVGLDAGPIYPAPAPRDASDPVQQAMLGHQWGTERLWEGVTGPWDNAWERGSVALSESSVFLDGPGDDASADAQNATLAGLDALLRAVGEEARTTTTLDERAALYGRLLATCGACHQAAGVEIPPYE